MNEVNPYTFTQDKPVVHYKALSLIKPVVGERYGMYPVDHPNTDLNGKLAFSSVVVAVTDDGFESFYTHYKRVD